jgi:hypothetical protein
LLDHRRYRERLDAGRAAGDVAEHAYAALRPEYLADEARSTAAVDELEAQAQVWRRDGRRVLDDCDAWLGLELDVLAARRFAEQRDAPAGREALVRRELERLEEVRGLLATR